MWAQLRRFRNLGAPAQKLFLRAWVMLPFVAASLRVRGFGPTQRSLRPAIPASTSTQNSADNLGRNSSPLRDGAAAELTARMVAAAARRSVFHAGCLERSLTLWWLLERQGVHCQLRIGTRKAGEQLEAHAWVEYDGQALNEVDDVHKHYAAFDEAFAGAERAKK
jgi:hypothetical protein